MTPEDILDPHRPLQGLIDDLRRQILFARRTDYQSHRGEIAPFLAELFHIHRLQLRLDNHDDANRTFSEHLEDFCQHLETLTEAKPTPAVLVRAPRLDRWCAFVLGYPQLAGRATGHPHLRDGARITTSPLLRIAPQEGWARTWSRYYRLEKPDRGFLHELIAAGRLPRTTALLDL